MEVLVGGRRRGVSDLEKVARNLETRLAPAMKAIGEAFVAHALHGFDTSTDPWGQPWAPLSGKTVMRRIGTTSGGGERTFRRSRVLTRRGGLTRRAERMLSGGGVKILIDTSALRNGLNSQSGDDWALVGFGGPHAHLAAIHHNGSDDGTLPSRKLLPIGDSGRPSMGELPADLRAEVMGILRDATRLGTSDVPRPAARAGSRR